MNPISWCSTTSLVPLRTWFLELTLLTAPVGRRTVVSFAILTQQLTTELAAPSMDIVGTLMLIVELDARAGVPPPPQVAPEGLFPVHTHPTANVELPMVASSATPLAPFTKELAVLPMDGVVTPMLTVGLAARADVMAQPVAILAAALERPQQLQ